MSFVKKMLAKKRKVEAVVHKRKQGVLESIEDIIERKYLDKMLLQAIAAVHTNPDGVEKSKKAKHFGVHRVYPSIRNMTVLVTYYVEVVRLRDAAETDLEREWYAKQLPSLWAGIKEVAADHLYQGAVSRYRAEGHVLGAKSRETFDEWCRDNPDAVKVANAAVRDAMTPKYTGETVSTATTNRAPGKVLPKPGLKKVKPGKKPGLKKVKP